MEVLDTSPTPLPAREGSSPPYRRWLIITICWSVPAFLFTAHAYLYSSVVGAHLDMWSVFKWAVSEWLLWAALTPWILAAAERFPIEGIKGVSQNIGVALVFAIAHVFLQAGLHYFGLGTGRLHGLHEIIGDVLPQKFHLNFATCGLVLGVGHADAYYRRYRDRKLRSSQLETALANAKLDALRMQINPHFLFNALNSISALIDDDPKAANRMLARLGDFMRLTLKSNASGSSSMAQELEFLRSYLQIEQVRFGDRLNVSIDVEPAAMDAAVPSLILQPIVENAFRHAFSKVESGQLTIRGRRVKDSIELSVADNGPGVDVALVEVSAGVGVSNTRARLETQYGKAQQLSLENRPGGGLTVTIRIPYERTT